MRQFSHSSPDEEIIFKTIKREAHRIHENEPILNKYVLEEVIINESLSFCVTSIISKKIATSSISANVLQELFNSVIHEQPELSRATSRDLIAVRERDAATTSYISILLNQKGFHAIQLHRLTHSLWNKQRRDLALHLQGLNSQTFGVDIHPACAMGSGIMIDHATGVVIGETCTIEDDVSIMQSVTLGGTGKESGERHPKIRRGAMIGAGAIILGNIEVGTYAKVGAGSVVITSVPDNATVVGVPAQIVKSFSKENSSKIAGEVCVSRSFEQ